LAYNCESKEKLTETSYVKFSGKACGDEVIAIYRQNLIVSQKSYPIPAYIKHSPTNIFVQAVCRFWRVGMV